MSKKRNFLFAAQEEDEIAKQRQTIDTHLSHQTTLITSSDSSLRLKAITFTSAHLSYASTLFLSQSIKPILEHQLWEETSPQVAQHIIKLLTDIAIHKKIPGNKNDDDTTLSIVDILHRYLEAHQFFDDVITTQIVSSLVCIAQEKGLSRELDRVLALNLLCTNKVGLRVKVLNLLALTTESKTSQDGKGGGVVSAVFEGFTKDPFPSVRKVALDGMVSVHRKGYRVNKGCYKRAVALLQDKDELVRLSAIKVVCDYVEMLHHIEGGHTSNQINQAFLQLCTLSRDMNMNVRSEALEALGGMGPLSESVLLQALSKKVLGQATKKTLAGAIQGRKILADSGKELDLLTLSAAGALLHGVEDEFSEVRIASIHSLSKLSGFSKQFADGALDLLMDMLNDDSLDVRMHTLHGLLHMAQTDHLAVQEKHMHMVVQRELGGCQLPTDLIMSISTHLCWRCKGEGLLLLAEECLFVEYNFLGMLEDMNADTRSAARRLLGCIKLPSISMFKMSIQAMMTNLDKHPQDEQDIISVMYHTGKIHSTFVVCSVNEFVEQIIGYSNGELGLDHPHVPTLLILMLAAQIENVGIRFAIPKKVFSYANYFQAKFPTNLFGLAASAEQKNSQLEDSEGGSENHNLKGLLSSSSQVPEKEGNTMGQRRQQNLGSEGNESTPQLVALDLEGRYRESSENVTNIQEMNQNEGYFLHKSEILCSAAKILMEVAGTWSLLKRKPLDHALKTLRVCREALQKIQRNFKEPVAVISFASLYICSVHFSAKLWANLTPGSSQHTSQSGLDSSQSILENLDKVVRRMRNCFLGLCEEQELHILELNALIYISRLFFFGGNGPPYVFRRLTTLISYAELLYKGDGLSHSSFLQRIKMQLSDEDPKSLCFLKLVQELPEHFPLKSFPLGELKEIRADLVVPNNSYEHPFKFVPGMPLGITVHITLHNATSEYRIWLAMVLGDSVQYNLIDFSNFQGLGSVKHGKVTLPFYSTVKVGSCFIEVSVMMQCPFDFGRISSNTCQAGPKGDLVSLSGVEKINLVASV